VIVLHPDSTNKLYSRWQIGTVAEVLSPNSYLVDMPDGARRNLHANKMRPCAALAQYAVLDRDREFGRVLALPIANNDELPSQRIDRGRIAHLTPEQQAELLQLLDEFPECFAVKPGLCKAVEHEIITLPGFVPKRLKAYKIPESLRDQVDAQIDVLLKDGFIRPSTSPMTSPIVCVLKKPKNAETRDQTGIVQPEVRLTVDYRFLNSYTQPFPFPVPDQDDVLAAIGRFKIVSV